MLPVEVNPVFLPPSLVGKMNDLTYARKTSVTGLVRARQMVPHGYLLQVLTRRDKLFQVGVVRRQSDIELFVHTASDDSQKDLMHPSA